VTPSETSDAAGDSPPTGIADALPATRVLAHMAPVATSMIFIFVMASLLFERIPSALRSRGDGAGSMNQ